MEPNDSKTRSKLGVPADSIVIIFVGRVTKDKGITELVDAFVRLIDVNTNIYLVIVGPTEPHLDPIPPRTKNLIDSNSQILVTGFCESPEQYLGAADIFCLPSYREGFGTVVVEAGAMELPAVATSITGLLDAVVDGKTGLLVPPRNVDLLAESLKTLIKQPSLRRELGLEARNRACKEFKDTNVNKLLIDEYCTLANLLDK